MVSNSHLLRPVWSSNCINDLLCIWHTSCNCSLGFLCCCGPCTCCCTPLFEQEPPSTPPSTVENPPTQTPRLLLSLPTLPSLPVKVPAPEGDQPPSQSPSRAGIAGDTLQQHPSIQQPICEICENLPSDDGFTHPPKSDQFHSSQVAPIPPTVQHLVLTTLDDFPWIPWSLILILLKPEGAKS